jgi:predicted nucleic acid-binding protein
VTTTAEPHSRWVLVDTSAYFALADQQDRNHEAALRVRNRLIGERWRLLTTNFVIAETHALLLARLGRAIALRVLQQIDRSTTTIVRVSEGDEMRARGILSKYDDKDFSFTDAASFAVMERLRMSQAFSFDRDFAQYGFTTVRPG